MYVYIIRWRWDNRRDDMWEINGVWDIYASARDFLFDNGWKYDDWDKLFYKCPGECYIERQEVMSYKKES
jgi:hypothetical protein